MFYKGLLIESNYSGHCACLQFKAFCVRLITVNKSPRCLQKLQLTDSLEENLNENLKFSS